MKYPKERAMAQVALANLKSKKLPVGTELTVVDFVEGKLTSNEKVPNDMFIATTSEGKRVRIPARELLKMTTEGGGSSFTSEAGKSEVIIPDKFKIVKAEDRKDRNDNPVYPIGAYKLGADFLAGKVKGWDNLVAGGIKEDNKLDVVQNYQIAIL